MMYDIENNLLIIGGDRAMDTIEEIRVVRTKMFFAGKVTMDLKRNFDEQTTRDLRIAEHFYDLSYFISQSIAEISGL
ncbi:unnamed protein product [Caenorhabditis nigoni]